MTGSSMSHRERVLAALNHQETDRIPIDFGGAMATTIYYTAYERLRAHLSVDREPAIAVKRSRTVVPDEEILQRFDIDTRFLGLGGYEGGHSREIDEDSFVDEWGTTWSKTGTHPYMNTDGPFYDKKPQMSDLESFEWPDADNESMYRGLAERAKALRRKSDCAIMLSLPTGIIHQGQFSRGYGEWLMDLHRHPDYVGRMADIMTDFWIRVAENALDIVGDDIDIVFFGDDMGTQQTTLFSPKIYRQLIKPRHKRMFDALNARKADQGFKVVLHSCGSVSSLFEDLIEMGIDAINPVQINAANMDPAEIKATYGERLAFWGAIDTQKVLPFGSQDEVRAEVRRIIDILGRDGGYVLNTVHNIQPDVPPENVVAMFEEARSYRPTWH
jgi:uroporphyrinogen decarboxylase